MVENDSKKLLLSVFGTALIIIAILGVTYAVFTYTSNATKENVIKTGAITMSYIESNENIISISDALPMSDAVGMIQNSYFDFLVSSSISGISTISYEIFAKQIVTNNSLESGKVKVYLEEINGPEYNKVLQPTIFKEDNEKGMLLTQNSFSNKENNTTEFIKRYRFRMWINETSIIEETPKEFKVKINMYANS